MSSSPQDPAPVMLPLGFAVLHNKSSTYAIPLRKWVGWCDERGTQAALRRLWAVAKNAVESTRYWERAGRLRQARGKLVDARDGAR
jgi:hypothetical protein